MNRGTDHLVLPPIPEIEKKIGIPFEDWAQQCHMISLAFVRSDLFPVSRVARGKCTEVFSQHSWVVLGDDCYDPETTIVDPTLWSYDDSVEGIWIGTLSSGRHHPHGEGNIWRFGRPPDPVEDPIELAVPLSREAMLFLELCGPLDRRGWEFLSSAPMQGWPSEEVIAAMDDTPSLRAVTPIDILGMVTRRNPQGLYLRED